MYIRAKERYILKLSVTDQ